MSNSIQAGCSGKFIATGKGRLTYIHGAGRIVKGLEQELYGLKIGGRKKVGVKPEDGCGIPTEKVFQEMPREKSSRRGPKRRRDADDEIARRLGPSRRFGSSESSKTFPSQ